MHAKNFKFDPIKSKKILKHKEMPIWNEIGSVLFKLFFNNFKQILAVNFNRHILVTSILFLKLSLSRNQKMDS